MQNYSTEVSILNRKVSMPRSKNNFSVQKYFYLINRPASRDLYMSQVCNGPMCPDA